MKGKLLRKIRSRFTWSRTDNEYHIYDHKEKSIIVSRRLLEDLIRFSVGYFTFCAWISRKNKRAMRWSYAYWSKQKVAKKVDNLWSVGQLIYAKDKQAMQIFGVNTMVVLDVNREFRTYNVFFIRTDKIAQIVQISFDAMPDFGKTSIHSGIVYSK